MTRDDTLAAVRAAAQRLHIRPEHISAGHIPGSFRLDAVTGGHAVLYAQRCRPAVWWTWTLYSADGEQVDASDGARLDLVAALDDVADRLITWHARITAGGVVHAVRDTDDGRVLTRCGKRRPADQVTGLDVPVTCSTCQLWNGRRSVGPTPWNSADNPPADRQRTRVAELLLDRLRQHPRVTLPPGAFLARLHPSRAQRVEGAWSWHVWTDDRAVTVVESIGSQWSMSALVAADAWDVNTNQHGDTHIDPLRKATP